MVGIFDEVGFGEDDDNSLCRRQRFDRREIGRALSGARWHRRGGRRYRLLRWQRGCGGRRILDADFAFAGFAETGGIKDFKSAIMVANFDAVNITGSSLARADEGLLLLTEELKRLDLPTLGRPDEGDFRGGVVSVNHFLEARPELPVVTGVWRSSSPWPDPPGSVFQACLSEAPSPCDNLLKIAFFKSLIPWSVVAEMRKVSVGLMPRRRNSDSGSESPRSDLLSRRRTGFFDLRADLAMFLSLSSGYFELSRVRRMRSAASMASAIWS